MKSNIHKQRARIAQFGLVVFALFGFSQIAHAATLAADHVIQNEVSVDYFDSGGNGVGGTATAFNVTDTVNITVNLIQAPPQVTNVTTDTLDPVSTSQSVTLIFEITSNANGLDDYDLDNPLLTNTTDTPAGASTIGSPSPAVLPLGGTSFASATAITFTEFGIPSSTAITVPMDSTAGDDLSGFTGGIGEILVFRATGTTGAAVAGDVVCTVVSVTDGAVVNDTATITILSPCSAGGVAREVIDGDQIGERANIEIVITAGPDAGVMDFTADINTTDDAFTTPTGAVSITVVAADLRVEKFVRNVTTSANNPTCGTAVPFECLVIQSGETFHSSGVTADPGDVLEYAILLYNVGGQVTGVSGVDPFVLFTTYSDDSARLYPTATATTGAATCHTTNGTCTVDDGSGAAPAVVTPTDDDVAADDFVFIDTTEVVFSGGDTGTPGAAPATEVVGGQIPASPTGGTVSNASVFTFQVTVDG